MMHKPIWRTAEDQLNYEEVQQHRSQIIANNSNRNLHGAYIHSPRSHRN